MIKGESPLGVVEAAKVLGVPKSWLYARVERPDCDLPYFKMGRYIRFYASSCRPSSIHSEVGRDRHDRARCGSVS